MSYTLEKSFISTTMVVSSFLDIGADGSSEKWAIIFESPSSFPLSRVEIIMGKYNDASNPTYVDIAVEGTTLDSSYLIPDDSVAAYSKQILQAEIASWATTSQTWRIFNFLDEPALVSGVTYALVLGEGMASGFVRSDKTWGHPSIADPTVEAAVYAAATWQGRQDEGVYFKLYSGYEFESSANINKYYDKQLIAIGADTIYQESPAGTMAEITAVRDDISTEQKLDAFEGFGKVFVANISNLKVLDFINAKCVTTDIGTNAPAKGDVLTGDSSGAEIIVDYCTSLTTQAVIYGYRTTAAQISDNETMNGIAALSIAFTVDGDGVDAPHWYDWTVYGGSTTYGIMPKQSGIGCLYRGRAVLAGNKDYPHQWYMSRQADTWDWNYISDDPQAPVAGNDADMGEIGDIVTALIPRKDDFLIIGCSNSIWLIRGDPAAGGSLDEISLSTGIFSKESWCWDAEDNLYFWGNSGIYILPITQGGIGSPQLITKHSIPTIVADEQIDPSTHRVTMVYDKRRHGILISVTNISGDTNSNYWIDLRMVDEKGNNLFPMFPEEYTQNAAAYSLHFYDAEDDDYRRLLVGSIDGYIRYFDDASKVDDAGAVNAAISAYVVLGPYALNSVPGSLGKLMSTTLVAGGGASLGTFGDTDGLTLEYFKGDDAETVLEDIEDGDTAFLSIAVTGTGRKTKMRTKVRGNYMAIKCSTTISNQTWSVEKLIGETKPLRGETY